METGMMKVVFSSIINGTDGDLSANEEKLALIESVIGKKDSEQSEIKYNIPKAESDEFKDKSSQEVFASLINASNCANLQTAGVIDGYVTFTREGAFLREYLY